MFSITTDFIEYKEQLRQITPIPYHCHLQRPGAADLPGSAPTVAVAIINGIAGGVIIALQDEVDPDVLTVIHLYIRKKYRRLGIGGDLLRCIEKKARQARKKRVGIIACLKRGSDQKEAISQFLLKKEWTDLNNQKSQYYINYYINETTIGKEEWFNMELPEGYTLLPWRDIPIEERVYLEENKTKLEEADQKNNDSYMDPLDFDNYEPLTSYYIKDEKSGHIAGWNLTVKMSDDILIFRKIYIMPHLRNKGLLYPLLACSIRLSFENCKEACFQVQAINKKMKMGIEILMGHLCYKILDVYVSSKELQ